MKDNFWLNICASPYFKHFLVRQPQKDFCIEEIKEAWKFNISQQKRWSRYSFHIYDGFHLLS